MLFWAYIHPKALGCQGPHCRAGMWLWFFSPWLLTAPVPAILFVLWVYLCLTWYIFVLFLDLLINSSLYKLCVNVMCPLRELQKQSCIRHSEMNEPSIKIIKTSPVVIFRLIMFIANIKWHKHFIDFRLLVWCGHHLSGKVFLIRFLYFKCTF